MEKRDELAELAELAETLEMEGDGLSMRAAKAIKDTTSDDYLLARINEKARELGWMSDNIRIRPNKTEREQAIIAASAALYVARIALERLGELDG